MEEDKLNQDRSNFLRRKFIAASTAVAAGITILPSKVIVGLGYRRLPTSMM